MVGAQVLDLADGSGEAHGEIEKKVSLVGLGGESGQVADVVSGRLGPGDYDDHGEQKTACCVEPPDAAVESD